jgi:hypothetical protein
VRLVDWLVSYLVREGWLVSYLVRAVGWLVG